MSFWKSFRDSKEKRTAYELKMKIIKLIRSFFESRGVAEFEAPILQPALIPESYLDIFATEERRVGLEGKITRPMFLLTSPESFQKKMLVAGFGSNFSITKSFRNGETLSGKHLSEFSLLEWYEKGKNYNDLMKTTEDLFTHILSNLYGKTADSITYNGVEINISAPWKRLSVNEAFKHFLAIDLEQTWSTEDCGFSVKLLAPLAKKHNLNATKDTTWEQLYNQLFLTYIEPNLPQNVPVILYDYPHELSPLAKPKRGESTEDLIWAERFEVMIAGLEICDTYTENTDAALQEKTFSHEIKKIEESGKKSYEFDYDFIEALKEGLPESSGNALGIDRMVMLFGNITDISTFELV